jgi:hypothetical protein
MEKEQDVQKTTGKGSVVPLRPSTSSLNKQKPQDQQTKTRELIKASSEAFQRFGQIDYQTVHKEVIDIKSCRTNIFIGTLGLLSAAAMAVLTIWGSRESYSWVKWLPAASLIPLFLLSSAILSTIHKARGINKREGYMEILGEYLLLNVPPKHYGGWAKANRLNSVCEMFLPKKSGSQLRKCPANEKLYCCIDASKEGSETVDNKASLHPDLLESFTSLSMYAYSFAYFVCLTTFLFSGFYAAKAIFKAHFSGGWYFSAIGIGLIPPSIYYIITYVKQTRCRGLIYPLSVLVCGLVWYFIYNELASFQNRWYALLAYIFGLIPSTVFGCLGYYFLDKVKSLRRGQYSPERWRYIWQIRFLQCKQMAEITPFPSIPDSKDRLKTNA